jgi:hypothetical protein
MLLDDLQSLKPEVALGPDQLILEEPRLLSDTFLASELIVRQRVLQSL